MALSGSRSHSKASSPTTTRVDKIELVRRATGAQGSEPQLLPGWQKNFVIGVDDCICTTKKSGKGLHAKDVSKAKAVEGAKDWVNKLYDDG